MKVSYRRSSLLLIVSWCEPPFSLCYKPPIQGNKGAYEHDNVVNGLRSLGGELLSDVVAESLCDDGDDDKENAGIRLVAVQESHI